MGIGTSRPTFLIACCHRAPSRSDTVTIEFFASPWLQCYLEDKSFNMLWREIQELHSIRLD